MNNGIYCKLKNSDQIYNSILIDEYKKCIFEVSDTEANLKLPQSNMNSSDVSVTSKSSEYNEWKCGMNVRAPYSEDGEYYEAIIDKIYDKKYASVRFLGYENEDAVKLEQLLPSNGKKAIKDQYAAAVLDGGADDEYWKDEFDDSWKQIDWKVGMACRAMYKGNNTIYEATIQEVNDEDRTAVLIMTGFGKPFEAKFEDMYESIPEYRVKQERTAHNYAAEKLKVGNKSDVPIPSTFLNTNSESSLESTILDKEAVVFKKDLNLPSSSSTDSVNVTNVPITSCNHNSYANYSKSQPELNALPTSLNNTCVFSQCQGMMQPQTDSDALACLISSNYLSGYYAGFYDCMRKFQNQNKL